MTKGIHETTEYLEWFLKNLLLGEHNDLKNRYLNVRWGKEKAYLESEKQDIEDKKQYIELKKQDIEDKKQYIESKKQDIEDGKQDIESGKQDIELETAHSAEEWTYYEPLLKEHSIKGKTKQNMMRLYQAFRLEYIFSRRDVMEILKITSSPASVLIKKMEICGIIEAVKGIGKGKYRFKPL